MALPFALPTQETGFRLILGADWNLLATAIQAVATAGSITIPAQPVQQLGRRMVTGEDMNTMQTAIQTIAAAKSIAVPELARVSPHLFGPRMPGGTFYNILVRALTAVS